MVEKVISRPIISFFFFFLGDVNLAPPKCGARGSCPPCPLATPLKVDILTPKCKQLQLQIYHRTTYSNKQVLEQSFKFN